MKKGMLSILVVCFSILFASGQNTKKRIDHNAYDQWQFLRSQQISKKGNLVTYEINPQAGDGYLYIYNPFTRSLDSVSRGHKARFIAGTSYAIFQQKPQAQLIRRLKIAKKKSEDFPKDSLGVFDMEKRMVIGWIADVKESEGNEESGWFMVLHDKTKEIKPAKKKKKKSPVIKSKGTLLEIFSPAYFKQPVDKNSKTKECVRYQYAYVTEIASSEKGGSFGFIQQLTNNHTDSSYIWYFSPKENKPRRIFGMKGYCKNLTFDESGQQLVFISSDDTAKAKSYSLSYWKNGHSLPSVIVESSTTGMNEEWCVGEHGRIYFSKSGQSIYFGTGPKPVKEEKDTLPEDEICKVDVWNWKDVRLQPEQLKTLERDKKKTWLAVYHLNYSRFVQLGDEKVEHLRMINNNDGVVALGISDYKYEREKSWKYPIASDYYLVDILTGTRTLILENHLYNALLSEGGKFLIYYIRENDDWFAKEISSGKVYNLTEKITDEFFEDDNGNPAKEEAYPVMGWADDDKYVYLYGKYDAWKIDPLDPSKATCLTKSFGRETKTIMRNMPFDRDRNTIDESFLLFRTFNEETKQAGYYKITAENPSPIRLIETDHKYPYFEKAETGKHILFTRMNFTESPDLYFSDIEFSEPIKISETNPQQKDYYWGTVELVRWTSKKGKSLQGLVYKPEDFDTTKKYPLLVYFYEKYSDDIHNYYSPRPSASIINPSEYAGNNYIVFIPDILYDEGSPGEDAYDCIVSGTEFMTEFSYVDKEKMGLQGQSWGGYQTAYLITQTNLYKAAMAGAPVSNMTSAYGGIRWGSGLSRMFQYEQTQSRLGVTLWEDRDRYIKNSPVFFADKVETPLLIMHNDKDGAVPWYQGIEYFVALRRLDKPVWMLNYNDDDHNLTRRANQKDLSIRMRQFFDHYLQGQPMPLWMKEGIPAIEKGKKTGYDLGG